MTQIALIARSSNWVEIVNVGGGFRTSDFLNINSKHMDRVSFGHTGPGGASLAIKADRLERFIVWAEKNGFKAAYKTHSEVWG